MKSLAGFQRGSCTDSEISSEGRLYLKGSHLAVLPVNVNNETSTGNKALHMAVSPAVRNRRKYMNTYAAAKFYGYELSIVFKFKISVQVLHLEGKRAEKEAENQQTDSGQYHNSSDSCRKRIYKNEQRKHQ